MGATTFVTIAEGQDAKAAFAAARKEAQHEHGHGGYSGSIAEKTAFVMMNDRPTTVAEARVLADRAIDNNDARIEDKRDPAGCISLTDGRFYFFGWAST